MIWQKSVAALANSINPMLMIAAPFRMCGFVSALRKHTNDNSLGSIFMLKFRSDSNDVPAVFLSRKVDS